ncbi:MAG: SDR family oxidoreductase [Pseudomonadota bacterium]
METVLITGANRGIGLQMTREFADLGFKVIACCRTPEQADELIVLSKIKKVSVFELDVTRTEDIASLVNRLNDETIDILVNNAGVIGGDRQSARDIDYDAWTETFHVNTVAPIRLSAALLMNLNRSLHPRIAIISSQMGAMSRGTNGQIIYRSTKAAVNKSMQVLAEEVKPDGITVCCIHPGWVQTDMGGPNATITAKESASGLVEVLTALTLEQSGSFLTWEGAPHPW